MKDWPPRTASDRPINSLNVWFAQSSTPFGLSKSNAALLCATMSCKYPKLQSAGLCRIVFSKLSSASSSAILFWSCGMVLSGSCTLLKISWWVLLALVGVLLRQLAHHFYCWQWHLKALQQAGGVPPHLLRMTKT